jgi:predicted DNA-binding transcriptional regulator YafY
MGKTAKTIAMLEVLNSRGVIKAAELAAILDTNQRNIIEYKKELEEIGYVVETLPGPHGGYSLNKKHLFPALRLGEEEKKHLYNGFNYLMQRNEFMYKADFNLAMSKVFASIMFNETGNDLTIINRFPLRMAQHELEKRYFAINQAIVSKNVIEIMYSSQKNNVKKHNLHPYKVFMYNNSWFLIAYNEKNGEIGYYKLNRIDYIKITDKSFRVSKTYKESDFIDDYGMKKYGDFYEISLKIRDSVAGITKERVYGKNQIIEELDDNTIILHVEMQNKDNILSFVLGFGVQAEVLSPKWLIEDVKKELNNVLGIYKK